MMASSTSSVGAAVVNFISAGNVFRLMQLNLIRVFYDSFMFRLTLQLTLRKNFEERDFVWFRKCTLLNKVTLQVFNSWIMCT